MRWLRISMSPVCVRREMPSRDREQDHGKPYMRRAWRRPCARGRLARGRGLPCRLPIARLWRDEVAKGGAWSCYEMGSKVQSNMGALSSECCEPGNVTEP